MQRKEDVRQSMKIRLSRLHENDRRVESQIIVRELQKLIDEKVKTVAVYLPYRDEPDINALTLMLLKEGKVVCMPKHEGKAMSMHQITSLDDAGKSPVTGIHEPLDASPVDESTIDLAIIPGRAFTQQCERMGRGNGGYDHWISRQRRERPTTRFVGVCYECQVLQEVPMEAHDEVVDMLQTAKQLFRRRPS